MNALIIDDERMPAQHLLEIIETQCHEISSTKLIFSPIEALEHLADTDYDIIFVDVQMPEINGIELIKRLNLSAETEVVFVTAYSNYAIDAFKADALHYIVKPVEEDEVIKAVSKAVKYRRKSNGFDEERETLSIFHNEEYHIVKTDQIIRLEADGNYTRIIEEDKEHFSSTRLGVFEKKLVGSKFVRCHKSHLINLSKIKKVGKGNGGYIVMNNEDVVPITLSKSELLNLLG